MVAVMAMTPVHLKLHGHEGVSQYVVSLHIAGMYAFSPLVGRYSDRRGRTRPSPSAPCCSSPRHRCRRCPATSSCCCSRRCGCSASAGTSGSSAAPACSSRASRPLNASPCKAVADLSMSFCGGLAGFGSGFVETGARLPRSILATIAAAAVLAAAVSGAHALPAKCVGRARRSQPGVHRPARLAIGLLRPCEPGLVVPVEPPVLLGFGGVAARSAHRAPSSSAGRSSGRCAGAADARAWRRSSPLIASIDRMWADTPPPRAEVSVRGYVSNLRKALVAAGFGRRHGDRRSAIVATSCRWRPTSSTSTCSTRSSTTPSSWPAGRSPSAPAASSTARLELHVGPPLGATGRGARARRGDDPLRGAARRSGGSADRHPPRAR